MSQTSLTDLSIRAAKPPEKGTSTLWDRTVRGLGVRCSQGGTKTFFVMVGKTRTRIRIGHYPDWTLKDARLEAKDARLEAMRIISDRAAKPSKKRLSFEAGFDLFKRTHTAKQRPRTRQETERLISVHYLPMLRTRDLSEIATAELTAITDRLQDTPGTAVHAFAAARLLFRWAAKRRLIERSPLDGVSLPAPIRFRERLLAEAELRIVWQACSQPEPFNAVFMGIVRLLILTGQRRSQIGNLRAEQIDYQNRTITWSGDQMKGGKPHTIPFGELTAALLGTLPKQGYLFPALGKDAPFNGFSKGKARFDRRLEGVAPYCLHDLRRSVASGWQRLGIPIHITETMLAHRSGSFAGIVSVYQRHSYLPELRSAVGQWEAKLASLLNPEADRSS